MELLMRGMLVMVARYAALSENSSYWKLFAF